MPDIRPVVLSGGSGTRLWPLSTRDVPKQFADLIGERSLFSATLERLIGLPGLVPGVVVSGAAHSDLVAEEVARAGVEVDSVLIEPTGRNTAPAIVAAALASNADDVLVILPSDHLIRDGDAFRDAVLRAADHASDGSIVTFGISPSRAETGYGYIELGEPLDGAFQVSRFKEKPDAQEASRLFADGRHVWNSGMFVARVSDLLSEAEIYCPDVVAGVRAALPEEINGHVTLADDFSGVEAISFDYAIMERTDRALVVPLEAGWDDVGSFVSLLAAVERDERGNHVSGDVIARDVERSFIKSTSRPVVVAGVSDLIVVETPDAVLVLPLDRAQDVRDLQRQATDD